MAFAIHSIAIDKNPSATSIGETAFLVALEISLARTLNFSLTILTSIFWFAFLPNTLGNNSGFNLPSITLQSVTVRGPPFR